MSYLTLQSFSDRGIRDHLAGGRSPHEVAGAPRITLPVTHRRQMHGDLSGELLLTTEMGDVRLYGARFESVLVFGTIEVNGLPLQFRHMGRRPAEVTLSQRSGHVLHQICQGPGDRTPSGRRGLTLQLGRVTA
ncbi:hypothetical protein ACIQB5_48425 [Streptomyces sp. NPDC088560]|uniref:hypothetical protein n=1 Tax=Streptomyces sp. NPDC088560 TaxID=3365868 RepID=UPI0037FDFBCB